MHRVLIAGCGDLGIRTGLRLAQSGCTVWGLRRTVSALPPAIQGVAGDLTDPETLGDRLARRLPGTDVVIFSVAAQRFEDRAYREAYVDGVRNLLGALQRRDLLPKRLIYVSSTSVFHQTDGSLVDETSVTDPAGFAGKRLLQGEALAADPSISETSIVRLAGIYGPGRTRLLDTVRRGEAVCHDAYPTWTNRIHVDDCARLLAHLTQARHVESLYIGVDDQPALDGEVKRWLAQRLGVAPPPSSSAPPSSSSRRMRSNKRCSNARLRASGLTLKYPTYREGYGALIDG